MTTTRNEAAVRARLDQWLEASRAMDLDAIRAVLCAGHGVL